MALFDSLDWPAVRQHYDNRVRVHRDLIKLHRQESASSFAGLALGISDEAGNYSAVEHGLGPKILATNLNAEKQVFDLAGKFLPLRTARSVPDLIRNANMKNLQIGVGSEISCMVNPTVCWVANTRTIWTHLVIKHADDVAKADEELKLYREADPTSEMAYQMWSAIHAELDVALTRIAEVGKQRATAAKVTAGDIAYLWADAIAAYLYEIHHRHTRLLR